MIYNKQINKAMASLLGVEETYDLRRELRVIFSGLTLEEAKADLAVHPAEEQHLFSITSSTPDNYCEDINLALSAAKRIAGVDHTFVLSLEDGTWKAAFGNYGDCAEYSGGNPAYCVCMATLKFMGKL